MRTLLVIVNGDSLPYIMVGLLFLTNPIYAGEWSGYIAAEARLFLHSPQFTNQHNANLSLIAEPEYYRAWAEQKQILRFQPFLRIDQGDSERSHFDLRELTWTSVYQHWELKLGIGKVYWGVIESLHLVDVINQTDLVENPDGEDKLGQPMIDLTLVRDWGLVDLFILPGFRERTFPGEKGRLRTPFRVNTERAEYESGSKNKHLDLALRWSQSIGDWDIGLAHFWGTGRAPSLRFGQDGAGRPILIPRYEIVHQSSADIQVTKGDWLWKLEALTASGQGDRYFAAALGFEYTYIGLAESSLDLGLLAEYLFDDRGNAASGPFQNDLFLGARLIFNDTQSSELLAGMIIDLDSQAQFYSVEASRRLGDRWKLSVEARLFHQIPKNDPLVGTRRDDHVQVELAWYF